MNEQLQFVKSHVTGQTNRLTKNTKVLLFLSFLALADETKSKLAVNEFFKVTLKSF